MQGLSESEYKQKSERIMRQIRAVKIEGLEYDLEREKLVTQRKKVSVDVAREQLQQEQVKLQIEQVETATLRVKLQEAKVKQEIAQVELEGTRDKLSFKKQENEINKGIYRERLAAMDLSLDEGQFFNDDRRAENRVKEIPVSPKRSYNFANASSRADLN